VCATRSIVPGCARPAACLPTGPAPHGRRPDDDRRVRHSPSRVFHAAATQSVMSPRHRRDRCIRNALCGGGVEHAAGANVGRGDRRQVFGREAPVLVGKQAAGLAQPARSSALRTLRALAKCGWRMRAVRYSSNVARAPERNCSSAARGAYRRCAATRRARSPGNPDDARCASSARDWSGRSVHAILVARQDHHQIVTLILHDLQQDLDGLLSVVALVLGPVRGSTPRR